MASANGNIGNGRQEENRNKDKRIGRALYLIYLGYLIAAVIIFVRLIDIQLTYEPDPSYAGYVKPRNRKETMYPVRGSILARDGKLIAMSIPLYEVHMDCTVRYGVYQEMKSSKDAKKRHSADSLETAWRHKAKILADSLEKPYYASKLGNVKDIYKKIIYAREHGNMYLRIGTKLVDHDLLKQLRTLPLFNENPNRGGFLYDIVETRQYPYGSLAYRTIGYVKNNRGSKNDQIGLEGKFDYYLHGQNGYKWMKETDGHRPIQNFDSTWVNATNGLDLRTTIDINIQDIADKAMRNSMNLNEDIYGGCMIVMDVETGGIRAMVNLLRDSTSGRLSEGLNLAISRAGEPGSVFKVTTLMSLIEDGYVKIDDMIPCNRGIVPGFAKEFGQDTYITHYMARTGKDSITIRHALELSSNYAFRYLAIENYGKSPRNMLEKLYRYKLGNEPMEFDLEGLATPYLPNPESKGWSRTDLPSVAIGYTVQETPLHILTFYNAIANGGKLMKPYLAESLQSGPNIEKTFGPTVLNASICSRRTADTLRSALSGVVSNPKGTGHSKLFGAKVPIAGKTGTAQMVIEKRFAKGAKKAIREIDGKFQYQATFVGFFPADKPKYSAIVTMFTVPVYRSEAVYGGNNPALAIRELVDNIYTIDPDAGEVIQRSGEMPRVEAPELPEAVEGKVPNVKGLGLKDAVYAIESQGFTCVWEGTGHVRSQTPGPGTAIKPGQTVQIILK